MEKPNIRSVPICRQSIDGVPARVAEAVAQVRSLS